MQRREFMQWIGCCVAGSYASQSIGTLLAQTASVHTRTPKRPNLLIVFPDQMRAHAMGFMKQDPVITPNLDRFAEQSLVLTQAVSNYPVCSPYRAMLMTGMYPHRNGVWSNCTSHSEPFGCELNKNHRCWSDVLKANGYSLGYIGKWHLESPRFPYIDCANNRGNTKWNEWCPPDRRHGFDFWYSYNTYDYHLRPLYWNTQAGRNEFQYVDQWGPEHEADLAIRYIRNDRNRYRDPDRPFALVVSMNPPHTPYHLLPPRYLEYYKNKSDQDLINRNNILPGSSGEKIARQHIRNYFAMVTGVDDQFGRILAALNQADLDQHTIVLFTSDHGNCIGSHNQATKNVHFEESMRIPFLIRWPEKIKPRRDDLLFSVPDTCPTILGLMNLDKEIPPSVQGNNYAELFRTGKGDRPGSQIYLWAPVGKPQFGRRGIRTHWYTMVIEKKPDRPPRTVLHDNRSDPYQLKNIAPDHPQIVRKLTGELTDWLNRLDDPWMQV
jgi:arylsulfatase A-like enzyme